MNHNLENNQQITSLMSQLIYKNGCWTCQRAKADPKQEYICPKEKEHLKEYQKLENKEL